MSKALIIIDIQSYFLKTDNGISGCISRVKKTKQVLSKFRNDNTYYSHSAFGVSQRYFLYRIQVGQEIHKNVTPLPGEKLIIKITNSLEKQIARLFTIYK
jgi:nicotinamidase-related amidase